MAFDTPDNIPSFWKRLLFGDAANGGSLRNHIGIDLSQPDSYNSRHTAPIVAQTTGETGAGTDVGGANRLVANLPGKDIPNRLMEIASLVGAAGVGSGAEASGMQNFLQNPQAAVEGDPWEGLREVTVDQTQTGAVPLLPNSVQPVAEKKKSAFDNDALRDLFTGWAMGGSDWQKSLALGGTMVAQGRKERGNRNETVEWLKGRGMDEAQAKQMASNPKSLQEYLIQLNKAKDPMDALRQEKLALEVENLRNPAEKLTDDVREYQFAKGQGFEGSFADWQTKGSKDQKAGAKAPSGYRWTDDSESALEPIPGGPGEEIPGELAARLGMAKNFLERAPGLRSKIANGDVTGVWDQRFALNGVGERGQLYQELESGTDALMRLLTGAGMNESEARAYARRYLPTGADTAETATNKLDRLTAELRATAEQAGKGRGGFKTGGASVGSGSTSNRIRWSVE